MNPKSTKSRRQLLFSILIVLAFFIFLWGGLIYQMLTDPFNSSLIDNYDYCVADCVANIESCSNKCSYLELNQPEESQSK